jgi:AhpD family alkylhydroperoxidase
LLSTFADRPKLTAAALHRWLPALLRRTPNLVSAYVVPGRVAPRLREATMLGVTSVNRCRACDRVHRAWARATGLTVGDPLKMGPDAAAAYAYGQAIAIGGPWSAPTPAVLGQRHSRELEAAAILMELANLAGNRFLSQRVARRRLEVEGPRLQIDGPLLARAYDLAMRVADRAGLRRARMRIAGGAIGDVLEIGIGTGLNLAHYTPGASVDGIDASEPALAIAARRASRLHRGVTLTAGGAAALPYPDGSFDVVVATFVLCSVGDVTSTLHESQRVLRPGGTLRLLEHARSSHGPIARLQSAFAPAWARAAGGCRLDHDVRDSLERAGLRIIEIRSRAGGMLVEIVASA